MNQVNSKALKSTVIIILSFLLLLTLTTASIFYFFPKEKVKSIIINTASDALGRSLTIRDLDYSLKGFSLNGVKIYESMSEEGKVLAEAENITLGVALPSLLQKRILISQVYFKDLAVNIEFDDDENSNIGKLIDDISDNKSKDSTTADVKMIRMDNTSFRITNPPVFLKPLEGEYSINSYFYFNNKDSIDVKKCRIQLPGNRGKLYPDVTIKIKKDDFEITGNTDLENTSLLWVYGWASEPLPYHIVNGRVTDLKISRGMVEGKVDATSTLSRSQKHVEAKGYCRVNIDEKTVLIYDVTGNIDKSKGFLKNLLLTFKGNLLGFELKDFDMNMSDLKSIIREVPDEFYGMAAGNISYANEQINANIKLVKAGYDFNNRLISGVNTDIIISNNIFRKEKIPVIIRNNLCLVSIASTDGLLKKMFLNISADSFKIVKDGGSRKHGVFNLPFLVTGIITANRVISEQVTITDFNSVYSASGNIIDIKKISAYTMGGSVSGNGRVSIADKTPFVTLNVLFNRVKVQDISSLSSNFKGRLYGVADGRINLSFNLSDDILKTINGKAEIIIDKGKLADTGIQNGLGIWLSELKYKLKDLEFNKIYGNISLNGNSYLINSFYLKSEDIQLKLNGKIDDNLIAENLLISLEFTKHFIQDLPVPAVRLGLGKNLQGKWYVVPFILNGDITKSKNLKRIQ